jgi:hypothetical protein
LAESRQINWPTRQAQGTLEMNHPLCMFAVAGLLMLALIVAAVGLVHSEPAKPEVSLAEIGVQADVRPFEQAKRRP